MKNAGLRCTDQISGRYCVRRHSARSGSCCVPVCLNRNALLGSPYRVAGPFTEYPAAVAAPPPDIGPVRFSLDTCGKSSRVIHDRMCKLPPPTGGTWRPCAAAETSRGKGGKKLPPAVLSGLGAKSNVLPARRLGRNGSQPPFPLSLTQWAQIHRVLSFA